MLLRKSVIAQLALRRTPPMCDNVATRNAAIPNAAISASAASSTRGRLTVSHDIDASLLYSTYGCTGWLRRSARSFQGQPVHSAQRSPVDVLHEDVRELAVSTNAVETVDARGLLEALTVRFVLVEKDGIGDGRARDVGAEESSPNAGDDRLEVVETEGAQLIFRHLPDPIADVAADIDGNDGLPIRREPGHGARPLRQSEEWEPRFRRPGHDVGQQVPSGEAQIHEHHRPVTESREVVECRRALDQPGQNVHRRRADHRRGLLLDAFHAHTHRTTIMDEDLLDRCLEPNGISEVPGEVVAERAHPRLRIHVPDPDALWLLAAIAARDRASREAARHLQPGRLQHPTGQFLDDRRRQLIRRRSGPGLDERDRDLVRQPLAVLATEAFGGRPRRMGGRAPRETRTDRLLQK